ncbi:hypothetical protein [Pantoea sp. B65]
MPIIHWGFKQVTPDIQTLNKYCHITDAQKEAASHPSFRIVLAII